MIDHITLIIFIIIFLFSNIGYGFIFSRVINKEYLSLNIGYQGLIGFFFLSVISMFTSFFFAHSFLFNTSVHLIGILGFIVFIKLHPKFSELKLLALLVFLFWIGVYVYKNHDDFAYYHLTYSLNLSENSFIVGTGNFSHGFRTFSSLFYYHSLLYLPLIKFYLFYIGPFFVLIFSNFILLSEIKNKFEINKINFTFFFLLLSFLFINIVFYRIGEHGTDRSAQILLLLIFYLFFDLFYFEKNEKKIFLKLNVLLILIFFASSMKAIYYLYLILIPFIFVKKRFIKKFLIIKNIFLIIFLSSSLFLNLITNYLNTGCFLYPAEKTCLVKQQWSIPKSEVKIMATHYEWWAKAGGGPGYKHELEKDEYIKNFQWLDNWIKRHFFNKVSDTLVGIIMMCIVVYSMFSLSGKKNNVINKNKYLLSYILPLIFLVEWFLNHPAMRYGGYVLFAIPLFVFVSNFLEEFHFSKNKIYLNSMILIFLTILIFNGRNLIRINKEINVYKYDIIKSPYFFIDNVEPELVHKNDKFILYSTKNKKMCWASKTPCSYDKNLKSDKFLWMNMVFRNEQ